jgi:DNA-binding NarL/FixJ family response regulator
MAANVLIVSRSKLMREGMSLLLQRHEDLHVVGEVDDDNASATKLIAERSPDVVVLHAPSGSHVVIESILSINAARAGLRIIVLTPRPGESFMREILKAGVAGCLTSECASDELVTAIRAAVQGRGYVCPRMAEVMVREMVLTGAERAGARSRRLAPREREVLRLIAEGQTTRQIAESLGVGAKTIETYRRRIMDKLDKHTVADLTKHAIAEGLTSIERST